MTTPGERLARVQYEAHLTLDAAYAPLAVAVADAVLRRATPDANGILRLSPPARVAILADVRRLLGEARPALVTAILEAITAAEAAAMVGAEPLPPDQTALSVAATLLPRSLARNEMSVVSQADALLRRSIGANVPALFAARTLKGYFSPVFAPRRDAQGRLLRADRPALIVRWPARAGAASAHCRLLMLTESTAAHGRTMVRRATRDGQLLRFHVSHKHLEIDQCDRYERTDVGFGPGIFPPDQFPGVPVHPRCFPAGVLVSGPRAVASTERWYEGDLVEIETAGGLFLPVTPNHPILTTQGWVAAGLLSVGDDVIRDGFGERVLDEIDPHEEQVPALIEDVARTLGRSLSVSAVGVPTATIDFHGDGMDGEVCVVRANGFLQGAIDSPISQPALDDEFTGTGMELSFLASLGRPTAHLEAVGSAALGSVSRLSVREVFFGAALAHHEAVGIGNGSQWHAAVNEALPDRAATDPQRNGNAVFGLACQVAVHDVGWQGKGTWAERGSGNCSPAPQGTTPNQLISHALEADLGARATRRNRSPGLVQCDRIVKVERRVFAGHVYNLETRGGWYIANGIIVHNCRCWAEPVDRPRFYARSEVA